MSEPPRPPTAERRTDDLDAAGDEVRRRAEQCPPGRHLPLEAVRADLGVRRPVRSHVATDCKRLRGSATATAPGMHLLAVFSDTLSSVIGQLHLTPGSNEITAALELLKRLLLTDSAVTSHAILTQQEICRVTRDRRGAYFFRVNDNQPALKAGIALALGDALPSGHGCRLT